MWRLISWSRRADSNSLAVRRDRHKFRPGSDLSLESRELLATTHVPFAVPLGGDPNAGHMVNLRGRVVHHAIVLVFPGSAGGTIAGGANSSITSRPTGAARVHTPNTTLTNGGRTVTTSTPATTPSEFSQPVFQTAPAPGSTFTISPTGLMTPTTTSTFPTTTTTTTTTTSTGMTTGTTPFGTLGTASNGQPVVFV